MRERPMDTTDSEIVDLMIRRDLGDEHALDEIDAWIEHQLQLPLVIPVNQQAKQKSLEKFAIRQMPGALQWAGGV